MADKIIYEKQPWVNDEVPLDEDHLNHMEDGIKTTNDLAVENANYIDELDAALIQQAHFSFDIPTKTLYLHIGSQSGNNITGRFHAVLAVQIPTQDEEMDDEDLDDVWGGAEDVEPEPPTPVAETFTVTKSFEELATELGWIDQARYTEYLFDTNILINIDASDQNSGKYYTNGLAVRIYQSGSPIVRISSLNGYKITHVTLTFTATNGAIFTYNGETVASGQRIDTSATSVELVMGNDQGKTNGQIRITAMIVVYETII